jgi:hypothetical protein
MRIAMIEEVKDAFEKQMEKSKSKNVAFIIMDVDEQNNPTQVIKVVPFNEVEEIIGSLTYVHISMVGNPIFLSKDTLIKLIYRKSI